MDPELGVAAGGKGMAAAAKFLLELGILEDLAVLGDPDRPVFIAEGLAASRKVDDREPPCAQGQPRLEVDVLVVRTAMGDRAGHRQEPRRGKFALDLFRSIAPAMPHMVSASPGVVAHSQAPQ